MRVYMYVCVCVYACGHVYVCIYLVMEGLKFYIRVAHCSYHTLGCLVHGVYEKEEGVLAVQ